MRQLMPARATHDESQMFSQQKGSAAQTTPQHVGSAQPGASWVAKQEPVAALQVEPHCSTRLIVNAYLFGELQVMSAPPIVGYVPAATITR